MTQILIRCDASLSIGSGHVIRCRTLARHLRHQGAEVTFLCRRQPGDLIGQLTKEFRVLILPEQDLLSCEGLEGRQLYTAWLGCSQTQDATDCLQALSAENLTNVDWLVIDHYGLDIKWQTELKSALTINNQTQLLVIDDLADRSHIAEILLDQNYFGTASKQRYQGLVPSYCRLFLGPHYALLGSEYAKLRPLVPIRNQVSRVLIFFGGVDTDNLTSRALEALTTPELEHLFVDVVLGRQSVHHQSVSNLVTKRPNTTLYSQLPTLAGMIARADIGIGAAGTTTWERACLKLPSLVVTIADNQRPFADVLDQDGQLELLGNASTVCAKKIRSALLSRISNSAKKHHQTSWNLTDGFGASRLAIAMLGRRQSITLQKADTTDEPLLSRWYDNTQTQGEKTKKGSLTFSSEQHVLPEGESDTKTINLIAKLEDGCPIGQICFKQQLLDNDVISNEDIVNYSLDKCVDGLGLEADLIYLGLQAKEETWGPGLEHPTYTLNRNRADNDNNNMTTIVTKNSSDATRDNGDSQSLPPSRITLLSDQNSWLNRYLSKLIKGLWRRGHGVRWIHAPAQLREGDVCLLLSCGSLLTTHQLSLHRHNLVVHESDLPKGKGWSPMTWQILEGADQIPITLFEACTKLDAGLIYLQQQIKLNGQELVEDWRFLQAQATLELCLAWLDDYSKVVAGARHQHGETTRYVRRNAADSQMNPENSLAEQFNLLRVVDNQHYPAFFRWRGKFFEIHIQERQSDHN